MAKITEKLIKDMEVGEVGYTVYWAIYKVPNDLKLNAYTIRGDYTALNVTRGTRSVRIMRHNENTIAVSVGALIENKDEFGTVPPRVDWDWMAVIPMPNE